MKKTKKTILSTIALNLIYISLCTFTMKGSIFRVDRHRQKKTPRKQKKEAPPPIPQKTYRLVLTPEQVFKSLKNLKIQKLSEDIDSVKIWIDNRDDIYPQQYKKFNIQKMRDESIKKIADTIDKSPVAILESIKSEIDFLESIEINLKNPPLKEAKKLLKTIIDETAKIKYPEIFLLYECDSEECGLNREKNKKRTNLENKLVNNLLKEKKEIIHVSVASGDLFPDFRVLTKLIRSNVKIKEVHIIDLKYEPPLSMINSLYKKSSGLKPFNISIDGIIGQISDAIDSNKPSVLTKDSYEDIYEEVDAAIQIFRFNQFLKLLTYLSKKRTYVYIHKNIDDYIKFFEKYPKKEKPNSLLAVDYYKDDIEKDLKKLKKKGLQKNAHIGKIYKFEVDKTEIK